MTNVKGGHTFYSVPTVFMSKKLTRVNFYRQFR